jgi:hypothetical protein
MAAQAAIASGAGVSESSGTGALAANDSVVASTGTQESTGSGALLAQVATAAGAGVSESTGTGALWAANALLAQGLESAGTGALEAQPTALAGAGRTATAVPVDIYVGPRGAPKTEQPAADIVGHGNLRAGPTHIRGTGQVTWLDQNELALLLLAA